MRRRDFLRTSATGLGASWVAHRSSLALPLAPEPAAPAEPAEPPIDSLLDEIPASLPQRFTAQDEVTLGRTGIRTSRLAMGTGTIGYGGGSNQTRIGHQPAVRLLAEGYHQNGLRFFDTADSYGSHPYVAAALKSVPRDRVTVMTKTDTRDAAGVRADIDRFRRELGTDYIDILLIHCVTEADWTTRYRGAMDVLSEAKSKGVIRAHGVSCHSLPALRAAAASPWVEVDLARLNPIGSHMDADPKTVRSILTDMRSNGKAVIGMKILGQGDLRKQPTQALRYALSTNTLDAFTIGAESRNEQDDLIRRIAAA